MQNKNNYVPDVLDCLANLSNDEVFTPPVVVNQMLDMLPKDVFKSKETTFLDPFTKTGVFLREITKRLLTEQISDYIQISNEIEEITKTAIQLAIKNKSLDVDSDNYEKNACKVGDNALKSHKDANKYLNFEINLQDALDHILKNQVFGIAITELTAQLARRSLYCSKDASGRYSVAGTIFGDNSAGNIRFESMKHTWDKTNLNGTVKIGASCICCGASSSNLERPDSFESHAYEFIHKDADDIRKEFNNMEFTVICGNPPYQLNLGNKGGNSSKSQAIYHKFIDQAIALNPKYLLMITPSRWMTRTQAGVTDSWVDRMINCNHFKNICDFDDANQCFPGVEIKGGVNYFLYENQYNGKCHYTYYDSKTGDLYISDTYLNEYKAGVVIRDPKAKSIIDKIKLIEQQYFNDDLRNFSGYISPADFFTKKPILTSNWSDFLNEPDEKNNIKLYLNKSIHNREYGYISKDIIPKNHDSINLNKVYIPAAGGTGNDSQILGNPFLGEPNSICSQTYRVIGYNNKTHNLTKEQCENIITYIKTKFFRYLVSIKKKTQNGPRGVYQFVPIQDFNKPWTDKELYLKYNLAQDEIDFIESMIKTMV